MEILHEEIEKHNVGPIEYYISRGYYALILGDGDSCYGEYHPMAECFSQEIWTLLLPYTDNEKLENYKFSLGKMCKNFIKLYFKERPVDYIILEVVF